MPGIGQQKARDVVAKLQGKMGRFGLIDDTAVTQAPSTSAPAVLKDEAVEVLIQLQYKKAEAEAMVVKALERDPAISSVEALLNEIYKQRVVH